MKNEIRPFLALGIVIGALSLQACTTTQGSPAGGDPAQVVTERAEARWRALIEGRLETAYGYFSAATRATLPYHVYSGRTKPGMWREAKVKSVACEAELCTAKIWLKYDIKEIKGLELEFDEPWIKENGGWWYVQKK